MAQAEKTGTGLGRILAIALVVVIAFGVYTVANQRSESVIVSVDPEGLQDKPDLFRKLHQVHITVTVGGKWVVRDKKIDGPWAQPVSGPPGAVVRVEAKDSLVRTGFVRLWITCMIHDENGHIHDQQEGSGSVACQAVL